MNHRPTGTFTRAGASGEERRCKDCGRWKPQNIEHFALSNKALQRKNGGPIREVWDSRCWLCSRKYRQALKLRPEMPKRPYAQRSSRQAVIPDMPRQPPSLDMAGMLDQIMKCPQTALNRSLGDSAIREGIDDSE